MIKLKVNTYCDGRVKCRVKTRTKGAKNLVREATGAIAGICVNACKNVPGTTPEMLMEIAAKLIANGDVKESE